MSISINVTPAASGGTFTVGSVSSQNLTLEVTGGIGPPGLGNLMIVEGDGIDIATVGNVATISTNLTIPANLADLADVAAAAPTSGQVLTYNGSAWTAAADATNLTGYATEAFVTSAVANLVDSSPAALDTLNELAAALGDDPNFSATITASLAGKAAANHTHNIADVTGLQAELDAKAATSSLATVATTGSYSDLAGIPTEFTPAAHNHTSADVSDFAAAASANAPIQTVNNATGDIVISNGTGLTLTANGSTLTLAAALPPSNLADLADVSGTPTADQALIYNGTEWQPGDIPAGTTINSLSGAVVLANGTGITLSESGQTLTLTATGSASGGDVDGGTFGAAGNVLTEGGDNLAAETGDTLTVEGGSSAAGDSIQLLRSSVAGATPSTLLAGELAINTEDGLLYWQRADGTIASADIDLTLATVATSGSYTDLSDLPTLGTAAATDATDYATAAQGSLADSSVQPGELATIATSGNYSDLSGVPASFTPSAHTHNIADVSGLQTALDEKAAAASLATVATSGSYTDLSDLPTLGTAAATDASDYATAAQGSLADTATQPGDLATVATSGSYSDLSGLPTEFAPSAHTHTAAEITDFGTAAAAAAPLQSINSLTGTLTITGSGGTTVTESGSTITVASTAPPTVLADLTDVSTATPSTGQVLKWTGSAWAPQTDATNGTGGGGGGGGYGSLLLFG